MLNEQVEELLERLPFLKEAGQSLAMEIHQAVLKGGEPLRDKADLLHGTWLGHPLHPMLTDVVIGAWSLASLFDFASLLSKSAVFEKSADILTTIGTSAAIPTALAGLTDFSTIPNPAADVGLAHGALNDTAIGLYLLSLRSRQRSQRSKAILLSTAGMMTMTAAAWLGGHLVYDEKVGVNHTSPVSEPKQWSAVMNENDLLEGEPARVQVAGNPVLLYRRGRRVLAVGAVCPHAGGPLEKGQFHDEEVQCPWHDSVFDLKDGSVVHGPSTYALPNYEARLSEGRVEVRVASAAEDVGHSHSHSHSH